METETQEYKEREDVAVIRICESTWHKEVKLKKCEECPICKSTSAHVLKRI